MLKSLKLNALEKKTFYIHLLYSLIEGIVAGIILLNEFVFIKSIKGSNSQLAMLFQFSVLLLLFSIFFTEFHRRFKNKKRLLLIAGFITRFPLFMVAFFPESQTVFAENPIYHYLFLAVFFCYFLANPIIFPVINLLLKNNYSHENFGKLYSYATSVKKTALLLGAWGFGFLLDKNNFAFTYIYPVVGVAAIFSIYLLNLIKHEPKKEEVFKKENYFKIMKKSFKQMINIIKTNRAYRDYQIGFMCYGFAFMFTSSVITIFFDKELKMSFSGVAFYKNYFTVLAIIILPFVGKLIGKIDPRKLAIYSYLSMLLYLTFIIFTDFQPYYVKIAGIKIYFWLIAAFTAFGFFTASMHLLWNIGSAYFCTTDEAADYQAIHLTLTGVRAAFFPLLGIFFFESFSYTASFILGIIALFFGIIWLTLSLEKDAVKPRNLVLKLKRIFRNS